MNFKSSVIKTEDFDNVTHIIAIDSKDRDIVKYPSPSNYRFAFPELKNIISVELIGGVIPDKNNVTLEPYLILQIPELSHERLIGTNSSIENSFAILQIPPATTSGSFINLDMHLSERVVFESRTILPILNHVNVKILKNDGSIFSFGSDSGSPNLAIQNFFVLRIICRQPRMISSYMTGM